MKFVSICCLSVLFPVALAAQVPEPTPASLPPVSQFAAPANETLSIVRDTNPSKPFSVLGPRGALLGEQDGTFEGWIFPWKIFSNMRISAVMKDYTVPIDVNDYAASIDVQPDHTTITYAHANFTIRETLLAPSHPAAGAGIAAYFQVQAVRPMDITFSFTPEMKLIWPGSSDDVPSPEWVKTAGGSGFYVLHLNFPDHASALAIPGAEPGILAPYQERPKTYPLQFVLHVDPATDADKIYPLLVATGENTQSSTILNLHSLLLAQDTTFASTVSQNKVDYTKFFSDHTSVETPDNKLDQAFSWAEVSINQLRLQTLPLQNETALAAGFYTSGDSARPGFGWFFGRDALFSLYAINSYGDFQLSRDEIEYLLKHQRADGKIMHERAQVASSVDWASLPYEYASSDATPLLIMELQDYLRISNDLPFIQKHWDEVVKAWNFETSHDSDGDGIYENTEGSGWVESWPPGMPHQEIYLAAVDQQGSSAFASLATATGHSSLAASATSRAAHIAKQIETEYYLPAAQNYAFSRNADGSTDDSATIFPAIAWWDGTFALPKSEPMLTRWASSEFSTDWGTRDLSPRTSFYDPISYHQGTVWPLFTGWVSLAEYRAGRNLSGYDHLKQNANLTWHEDLGAVTELLSGEFYRSLGRSTSHQLWSSAMVVTPVLRGLFGISWDAPHNTLALSPQLPADWDHATVHKLPIGSSYTDLAFARKGRYLIVTPTSAVLLQSPVKGAKVVGKSIEIPLPPVEVSITSELPTPGSATSQMKVLSQQEDPTSFTLQLAAPGGSTQHVMVRVNEPSHQVQMDGQPLPAKSALQSVAVVFPPGAGYQQKTLKFTW